ncbi:DciA family protein [candidate division KSB1 bacterium]
MKYLSRKPKPLTNVLHGLIKNLGIEKGLRQAQVFEVWDEVVGNVNAKKAKPSRIDRGVLFVKVSESAWRQELFLQRYEIKSKLNNVLKGNIIKDIRFE